MFFLVPLPAFSQSSYFTDEPVWYSGPASNPNNLALADVNGDGYLDVAFGVFGTETLYLNEGGVFSKSPAWNNGSLGYGNSTNLAFGDVDGDGDADLVLGNSRVFLGDTTGARNEVYLNIEGTITTRPVWVSSAWNQTRDAVLGDLNGDGRLDLVCANAEFTAVYLNDGLIFEHDPAWIDSTCSSGCVALGDVDGDGNLDIVCGSTLFLNESSGLGAAPVWTSGAQFPPRSVALGDINGDGDLDLVISTEIGGPILYLNEGGVFASSPVWSSDSANTFDIALGDVDGDGDLDLVCGNYGQSNTLYLGEDSTFTATPVWSSVPELQTKAIALGDVDRDGALDLVCGNRLESATLYRNVTMVFSSEPSWSSSLQNNTESVALGDVDLDGDLDLVCGTYGGSNTLYLNQRGSITTTPAWSSTPSTPINVTSDVVLGDVDGDGSLDLVCGNDGANTVYLNHGGLFSTTPDWLSVPKNDTDDIELADVDGDGDLDLMCAGESNTLYLNQGGVFSDTTSWVERYFGASSSLALGDLDGDGYPDLVYGNHLNDFNVFMMNAFIKEGIFYPFWRPWTFRTKSVALEDVDGDGDLDFITGNYGYSNLLYELDSNRKIELTWSGPMETTNEIALEDVNGDGLLDLVSGNYGATTYYPNIGGVFTATPKWSSPSTQSTASVALGDIDMDGDLDLVCGTTGESNTIYSGTRFPLFKNDPTAPTNQLPNNPPFLRYVDVQRNDINSYRVKMTLFDVESDPVWILPEYQFRGEPVWRAAEVGGRSGRVGPFASSPEGTESSFEWDTSSIPHDSRDIILRLTTIESPRRVSLIQHTGSYLKHVGPMPSVSTYARPSSGTEFFEGRDIIVELSLPPGASSEGARLYFRRGGEAAYQQTDFDNSSPKPLATIASDWIGARGIEYWTEVQTASGTLTDPRKRPSEDPHTIRVTVIDLEETRSHPGERYRMMSVPLQVEGETSIIKALEDDIGFPDPIKWRMFAYGARDSAYIEVPKDTLSAFEHGRGYWLITRESHRLDTDPAFGRSAATDEEFEIALEPGWNLIGQPYAFPVAWDSMGVDSLTMAEAENTLVQPPVARVGGRYAYDVERLDPWEGYWVKNLTDSSLVLKVPPREAAGSAALAGPPKQHASENEWTIAIEASSLETIDSYNYVGMTPGACSAWDRHDRSEAPMGPGRSLSLYFPHAAWKWRAGCYTVDIRGRYEAIESQKVSSVLPEQGVWGHVWHFDVAKSFSDGTAGDEVVLEFTGLESVPAEAQLLLVDRKLERLVDLGREDRYAFFLGVRAMVTYEEDARFVLLAGSEEFINDQKDELPGPPARTSLHQNYPNPFNPSTIIRYDIATPGKVEVRIYDVRGTLVKLLESRHREAGRYEIGWNGENNRDEKVSSGVYFCCLNASAFMQTRKMVLLK